ncbi:MAG TPA: hypothetical protein VNB68_00505, partial [Nitrososphaeraceae archaeon]|nr:hypothetical protein [Nitrososphaeraceae archaeon]
FFTTINVSINAQSLLQPDKNYHFFSLKCGETFILLIIGVYWEYLFVLERKSKHCVNPSSNPS